MFQSCIDSNPVTIPWDAQVPHFFVLFSHTKEVFEADGVPNGSRGQGGFGVPARSWFESAQFLWFCLRFPSYGIFFSSRKWWPRGFQGFPPPRSQRKPCFFGPHRPPLGPTCSQLRGDDRGLELTLESPTLGGKTPWLPVKISAYINQSIEHWEVKYPSVHGKFAIL